MTELGVKVRVEPPTRMGMRRVVLAAFTRVGALRVLVVTRERQIEKLIPKQIILCSRRLHQESSRTFFGGGGGWMPQEVSGGHYL